MGTSVDEITSFYLIGYSDEHLEERVAFLYTAGYLGGAVSPQVGSRAKPRCGDRGRYPLNNFSAYDYKTEGN